MNEDVVKSLSWWKRIVLRLRGYVFLRCEKRQGWKAYLPIYLVKCKKHGYYEDYPHGFPPREYFLCPKCLEEVKRVLFQSSS